MKVPQAFEVQLINEQGIKNKKNTKVHSFHSTDSQYLASERGRTDAFQSHTNNFDAKWYRDLDVASPTLDHGIK